MSTSDEDLLAYADELLPVDAAAQLEARLRDDAALRERLQNVLDQRDSGALSVGEIWRHERLSCPTRSELGLYLMRALERQRADYVSFHLKTVRCAYCEATFAELTAAAAELDDNPQDSRRREQLFASSAGLLKNDRTQGAQ
ncbi:hypothetical protein [Rubinisphaera margarita]|uniref:hypothetical protein n=1 Tax=Rubinisphaera margarita TaxID=2909586 RepID=UPI001EE8A600|nr:hypothetical protein [Rubinisphaera margarita]MCG6157812.1 hypothetical protein [Rubinisphaera margarita]